MLCPVKAVCGEEPPPTKLFVRKIPSINFPDEEANEEQSSLLFVDTESGMYRFQFNPVNQKPPYTKIEIQHTLISPLFPH